MRRAAILIVMIVLTCSAPTSEASMIDQAVAIEKTIGINPIENNPIEISPIENNPIEQTIERSIEIESLYGLPWNRPPIYRRGPSPPAVREHDRYRYLPRKRFYPPNPPAPIGCRRP